MSSSMLFVVAFEHAHRAFKCVRLDGGDGRASRDAAHWIVTLEGRTIWSFDANEQDTREIVQEEVVRWWDSEHDQALTG